MKDIHLIINSLIEPYQERLGKNYLPYKNHVHRIANLAFEVKKNGTPDDKEKIAIAAVFHDIGMWTGQTFDYLDPSIVEASKYLRSAEKQDWEDEVMIIIEMHHKRTPYKGRFEENVEAFRKADLIDLSKGRIRFGISKETVRKNLEQYPMLGFRGIIWKAFFKNLLKHPLNPLPMFKK